MGIEFGGLMHGQGFKNHQIKICQYYFCPQQVLNAVVLLAPPGALLCEVYI